MVVKMMSDQDHQPFGGTIVLKVNMTCNDLGGGGGAALSGQHPWELGLRPSDGDLDPHFGGKL